MYELIAAVAALPVVSQGAPGHGAAPGLGAYESGSGTVVHRMRV